MDKKSFLLAMFVVVGILLGVGFVINQTRDPLLQQIVNQQKTILQSHQAMMNASGGAAMPAGSLQQLEQRLAKVEDQLSKIQPVFDKIAPLLNRPPQPMEPQEDLNTVHQIPVDHTVVIGKKDAPVTITEFVDFECPFCARFHAPIVEILKQYPDKVNILVKHFPLSFHPQAKPGSKAALAAAEQGKFKEMVDAILVDNKGLNEERFKKLAGDIGLNVDKFLKDLKDKDAQYEAIIQKDMELGNKIGVRGTPTFYLNGRQTNARDAATWKQQVDAILNK